MLTNELVKEIKKRVRKHHKIYDLTIKGEYWEEIFARSVESVGGQSDWTADRSHDIGKDQICLFEDQQPKRISNKSGVYTISTNKLKISGSRSTTYPTLEEKIKHFSNKQEDLYFCLATSTLKTDLNYYLFCFDTNLLDYQNAEWEEQYSQEGDLIGWKCSTDAYDAWIRKGMSDQLWTHIKLNNTNIKPICITR